MHAAPGAIVEIEPELGVSRALSNRPLDQIELIGRDNGRMRRELLSGDHRELLELLQLVDPPLDVGPSWLTRAGLMPIAEEKDDPRPNREHGGDEKRRVERHPRRPRARPPHVPSR